MDVIQVRTDRFRLIFIGDTTTINRRRENYNSNTINVRTTIYSDYTRRPRPRTLIGYSLEAWLVIIKCFQREYKSELVYTRQSWLLYYERISILHWFPDLKPAQCGLRSSQDAVMKIQDLTKATNILRDSMKTDGDVDRTWVAALLDEQCQDSMHTTPSKDELAHYNGNGNFMMRIVRKNMWALSQRHVIIFTRSAVMLISKLKSWIPSSKCYIWTVVRPGTKLKRHSFDSWIDSRSQYLAAGLMMISQISRNDGRSRINW